MASQCAVFAASGTAPLGTGTGAGTGGGCGRYAHSLLAPHSKLSRYISS